MKKKRAEEVQLSAEVAIMAHISLQLVNPNKIFKCDVGPVLMSKFRILLYPSPRLVN